VLDLFDAIAAANGGRDRRFRVDGATIEARDRGRLAALNAVAPLGSGWPAAPLTPMLTLRSAAAPPAIADAVAALTRGAAFAEFQEREKGTIARGQLADMVILSEDIFATANAARIPAVRVLTTIVGGRVVHQQKP
jgi:predicted amidohydrolase YtcJ